MTESGPMPVREGELVAGKYRVEEVIGTGGMGVIVAARHEQLDQRVAIKFVRSELLGREEGVQRFLREARAAAKLKSEHAARVLDVGMLASGVPYMVMELLEGSDLARWLAERGPLPVELAAEWVAQACEALAEAHAAGIVHRDLKPQNLFLSRTVGGGNRVKVLDFGVSKSMESVSGQLGALTSTRAMLGSPLYMSPEQMRSSRDVDARADVWALGVVLFELLTRRMPFEAEALPELCLKVVNDPPLSLHELRPDVPEAMVQVVLTCLQKDRNKRFANAAQLAAALEAMLPPRSRVVVDRARWALADAPGVSASLRSIPGIESRATPSMPSTPSMKGSPPAAPTLAPWDSGKGTSLGGKRRSRVLWVGASLFLVAATAGAMVGLRRHTGEPGGVGAADPRAIATAGPPGAVAAAPAREAPTGSSVTVLAPVTSGELAPLLSAHISSTLPPPASAPSRPSARPGVAIPTPVLSRPSPPVGPSASDGTSPGPAKQGITPPGRGQHQDDDIPALR